MWSGLLEKDRHSLAPLGWGHHRALGTAPTGTPPSVHLILSWGCSPHTPPPRGGRCCLCAHGLTARPRRTCGMNGWGRDGWAPPLQSPTPLPSCQVWQMVLQLATSPRWHGKGECGSGSSGLGWEGAMRASEGGAQGPG